jgi:hypothetical protein
MQPEEDEAEGVVRQRNHAEITGYPKEAAAYKGMFQGQPIRTGAASALM